MKTITKTILYLQMERVVNVVTGVTAGSFDGTISFGKAK